MATTEHCFVWQESGEDGSVTGRVKIEFKNPMKAQYRDSMKEAVAWLEAHGWTRCAGEVAVGSAEDGEEPRIELKGLHFKKASP